MAIILARLTRSAGGTISANCGRGAPARSAALSALRPTRVSASVIRPPVTLRRMATITGRPFSSRMPIQAAWPAWTSGA